jgi:small conductance mechanosensitive channel
MVGNLGDSAVEIYCRFWVKTKDYWDARFYINEKVKEEFDKNNINIPYPQQDIHLIK